MGFFRKFHYLSILFLLLLRYTVAWGWAIIWFVAFIDEAIKVSEPVFPLGFWLVWICPNDKFIEIFAQRFHYFEDPFFNFFALNLLFLDTSYSLALKYSSFLFKFFSFAFYNINFWFKISKICPKISHLSQISHSKGNTAPNSIIHVLVCTYMQMMPNFLAIM